MIVSSLYLRHKVYMLFDRLLFCKRLLYVYSMYTIMQRLYISLSITYEYIIVICTLSPFPVTSSFVLDNLARCNIFFHYLQNSTYRTPHIRSCLFSLYWAAWNRPRMSETLPALCLLVLRITVPNSKYYLLLHKSIYRLVYRESLYFIKISLFICH